MKTSWWHIHWHNEVAFVSHTDCVRLCRCGHGKHYENWASDEALRRGWRYTERVREELLTKYALWH